MWVLLMKKNRSKKSRASVPLNLKLFAVDLNTLWTFLMKGNQEY